MSTPLQTDLPYPSRRQPVLADAVVATSQPLATSAGMEALAAGGTAVDAAIAAAATLTVTEPTSNGIGGDLFAIISEPDGTVHALDSSGRSPAALDPDPLTQRRSMPLHGWDPVTVPGAVRGWRELSDRFGRLDFARLLDHAVRHAESGYPVAPLTAAAWTRAPEAYASCPDFAPAFLPGGRAPRAGERVVVPGQAATLRELARTGGESLYTGKLAEAIAAHAQAGGGALRATDLAGHRSEWVDPIALRAWDHEVLELPPATQGIATLIALGILDRVGLADAVAARGPDDVGVVHLCIEAMKLALAVTHDEVADRDRMRTTPAELLAPAALDRLADRVDPERAQDPGHGQPAPGGTVYLSAGDDAGMAVSLIQSNYYGFGSGVVVPDTGIALHNRGAGFSTDPASPNVVGPGVRPFHTIIPALARDPEGRPTAFGVMGGPMQPQGHVQMIVRSALASQGWQAAIDAPRWRVEAGLAVALEAAWPPGTAEGLARLGHLPRTDGGMGGFGGAQAVARGASGWVGASDPRKDGHAAGR